MLGLGLIRLLLSFTVVITHTHSIFGFTLGNPVIAVRQFFIISGFYMALILNEKYTNNKTFLVNRFLKIFPIYWVVLLLTALSCLATYILRNHWGEMTPFIHGLPMMQPQTVILIVLSQIAIIGRNLIMFFHVDTYAGLLRYLPLPGHEVIIGQHLLLVPQAWTLVLEIWFYLLAPFIVKHQYRRLITLVILSLIFKYLTRDNTYAPGLWTYRFFPAELVYFLGGVLSYKLYSSFKKYTFPKPIYILSVILLILGLALFNYIPGNIFIREWWYYLLVVGLLPFVFSYSKTSYLDRHLGNLSYPVYITHILVNNIVNPLIFVPFSVNFNTQPIIIFVGSVIFSQLLLIVVQKPMDKIRSKNINI